MRFEIALCKSCFPAFFSSARFPSRNSGNKMLFHGSVWHTCRTWFAFLTLDPREKAADYREHGRSKEKRGRGSIIGKALPWRVHWDFVDRDYANRSFFFPPLPRPSTTISSLFARNLFAPRLFANIKSLESKVNDLDFEFYPFSINHLPSLPPSPSNSPSKERGKFHPPQS